MKIKRPTRPVQPSKRPEPVEIAPERLNVWKSQGRLLRRVPNGPPKRRSFEFLGDRVKVSETPLMTKKEFYKWWRGDSELTEIQKTVLRPAAYARYVASGGQRFLKQGEKYARTGNDFPTC